MGKFFCHLTFVRKLYIARPKFHNTCATIRPVCIVHVDVWDKQVAIAIILINYIDMAGIFLVNK